ncbi:MAG: vanadium-dependent haloperoxidase [Myxococcota bacterium]
MTVRSLSFALTAVGLLACKANDFTERANVPNAALMGVAGADGDVWAVGAQSEINAEPLVLTGRDGNLEPISTGQLQDLWWVHAWASDDVMLAGNGSTVLHWQGDGFTRMDTPGFGLQTIFGLWGPSSSDVWAVGGFAGRAAFVWRYDGTAWTEVDLPDDIPTTPAGELPSLFKVWGRSANDVWIVGGLGTVLHWNGEVLSVVPSGTTADLFTVTGNDDEVVAVGGGGQGVVIRGGRDGFVDETPPGAPLIQAAWMDNRETWIAGAQGYAARKRGRRDYKPVDLGFTEVPGSIHAVWSDGRDVWAVGGDVLTPELDEGVIYANTGDAIWRPDEPPTVEPTCPDEAIDPYPEGSMARRWNEQLLNSIRRDIPDPPVHARNLLHTSIAMFDAWAAYQDVAVPVVTAESVTGDSADQETAIAYAAFRVMSHRYENAAGGAVSLDCYRAFMGELGLDPTDDHTDGDDAVAVGNRIGEAVITRFVNDGANEANGYADTTGWEPGNPVMIVDRPGTPVQDPDVWQQLNLATAETQNGIVLESSVQPYIGPHWRNVEPFALVADPKTGLYSDPGPGGPSVSDPEMADWVVQVIQKTAELDHLDGVELDIGPRGRGNNTLGTDDGEGYATNPVTGEAYEPNVVPRGDFARVVAEMWADGPKSETPPGHWTKIANEVSDRLVADELRPYGEASPVDRLAWDIGLYLAVTGAVHDAAVSAWELKRDSLGPRPITLIRWMAENGQRTDPDLPSYSPDGLPLVDGLIELITEETTAPGERHRHLKFHIGELAVWSWPGEPGDRDGEFTELRWMRALDWIPYQRRTFVTPAFPGYTSGHSTFSRAAAEALTAYTGSPWFPDGLHEFVASANNYLVFEEGPSVEVRLQWASYYDAADQAGQSRLWGGIHVWPDDWVGRINGQRAGVAASERAQAHWDGTAGIP